jgi:hypothetical protein
MRHVLTALLSVLLIFTAAADRLAAQEITGFGTSEKNPIDPSMDFASGWSGTVSTTSMTVTGVTTFGGGVFESLQTSVPVSNTSSLTLTGVLIQDASAPTFQITVYDSAFDTLVYTFLWTSFGSTQSAVTAQLVSTTGHFNGTATAWELDNGGGPGNTISFEFDELAFGSSSGGSSGPVGATKQTITFPTIATQTLGAAPFAINATASSGLAVTYTVVSGPATVSGNMVTLTGAGPVTIQASQAGNSTYAAAVAVSKTFTVKPGIAQVTLSNLAATYNGSPQSATAATSPTGLNVTLTYAGKATPPTAAGSYAVVATVSGPNYTGSAKGTFVIGKATAAVTLGGLSAFYNGAGHAATATTNPSGFTVTFTYNAKATLPISLGSYAVVGTISDLNYMGSSAATMTVSVSPAVAFQGATDAEITQGVFPNGVATTVYYQYGLTNGYGSLTPFQILGSGKVPVNIYTLLSGLLPNTLYHYRLATVIAGVTTFGPDLTFTTLDFDTTLIAQKGDTVTDGSDTFASFGNPAVNVADTVAFTGTLTTATGVTTANNVGIWTVDDTDTELLIARIGSPAVGSSGNFLTLSDPVINENGNVAFRATAGAKPALAGIWSTDDSGAVQLIALQGSTAVGTGGGTFATFTSLGLSETAGPVVYATLTVNKTAGISATNDAGIFEGTTAANFQPVLRLGDVVGGKTITKLVFQSAVPFVNGQTRGFNASGGIVAQATFSDRTIGIVSAIGGTKTLVAVTGVAVPSLSNVHFLTLGPPAIDDSGTISFEATTNSTVALTQRNIFTTDGSGGFTSLSASGSAPGDPVLNNNNRVAYLSTVSIGTGRSVVSHPAVFYQTSAVAEVGGQAPGCPIGASFATFTEIALPDQGGDDNTGGVIFLGTLTANTEAGVASTNNLGIWAVDNAGNLQLIVRTGDIVNGKTITGLAFLPSPAYVVGQSRSFAPANGDLVYLATFSDKSTAILNVVFP